MHMCKFFTYIYFVPFKIYYSFMYTLILADSKVKNSVKESCSSPIWCSCWQLRMSVDSIVGPVLFVTVSPEKCNIVEGEI